MNLKINLVAFLIEGPAGGVPGFQESIVFTASQSELEEKIRSATHCPDAVVNIVNPVEWNPPKLAEISDHEISKLAQAIMGQIMEYLIDHNINIDRDDFMNGGTEIRNPVSGKVFFVFKSYAPIAPTTQTAERTQSNIPSTEEKNKVFSACSSGDIDKLKKLLDAKPDLANALDDYNGTPLHIAANEGGEEIILMLIEKGANVNHKDNDSRTPLFYAVLENHQNTIKLLISKGADLDARDKHGGTSLHCAASRGHKDAASFLITSGANVNITDPEGKSPLYIAAYNGHVDVVSLLLENGANVNTKDTKGRTSLYWAAYNGDKEIVALLMRKGADINTKDSFGATPLQRAIANGHTDCANLLQQPSLATETKQKEVESKILPVDNPGTETQSKAPSEDKVPTPSPEKSSKRSSTPIRWIATVAGVLLVFVGLSFLLFVKPPATPTPPTSTLIPTATSTLIPTATLTPTQVELGQWHTESAGGFSYIPPIGWDVVEYSGSKYKIAQGIGAGNFKPNINFMDEAFSDSLDKYVDASISSFTQTFQDARIVDFYGFKTNDGQLCLKVVAENTQSGMKLSQTFYFFDAGTRKFVVTYSRLADSGQENDILVDESMKTFRLEGSSSTTYLSQFQPTLIELPFGEYSVGEFAFTSPYPEDPVRKGDPIVVHGVEYPHGIFAHAPSRLVYDIGKGNFEELSATLGLVDLINNGINCGDGVNFVVVMDGKEIYRSNRLYGESEPVDILLPITGGDELTLIVEDGGNDDLDCDWAIWGDPHLR